MASDPLGLEMWRFFLRLKVCAPAVKRMENLSWRRMYVSLRNMDAASHRPSKSATLNPPKSTSSVGPDLPGQSPQTPALVPAGQKTDGGSDKIEDDSPEFMDFNTFEKQPGADHADHPGQFPQSVSAQDARLAASYNNAETQVGWDPLLISSSHQIPPNRRQNSTTTTTGPPTTNPTFGPTQPRSTSSGAAILAAFSTPQLPQNSFSLSQTDQMGDTDMHMYALDHDLAFTSTNTPQFGTADESSFNDALLGIGPSVGLADLSSYNLGQQFPFSNFAASNGPANVTGSIPFEPEDGNGSVDATRSRSDTGPSAAANTSATESLVHSPTDHTISTVPSKEQMGPLHSYPNGYDLRQNQSGLFEGKRKSGSGLFFLGSDDESNQGFSTLSTTQPDSSFNLDPSLMFGQGTGTRGFDLHAARFPTDLPNRQHNTAASTANIQALVFGNDANGNQATKVNSMPRTASVPSGLASLDYSDWNNISMMQTNVSGPSSLAASMTFNRPGANTQSGQESSSTTRPPTSRVVSSTQLPMPSNGTGPPSSSTLNSSSKPTADQNQVKKEEEGQECVNCHTGTTPLWRRDPAGNLLCNACGLFYKVHGKKRPLSLKTDVIKTRNRPARNGVPGNKNRKREHLIDGNLMLDNQNVPTSGVPIAPLPQGLSINGSIGQTGLLQHTSQSSMNILRSQAPKAIKKNRKEKRARRRENGENIEASSAIGLGSVSRAGEIGSNVFSMSSNVVGTVGPLQPQTQAQAQAQTQPTDPSMQQVLPGYHDVSMMARARLRKEDPVVPDEWTWLAISI